MKTNKIVYELNTKLIDSSYEIYSIKTTDSKYKLGSMILDNVHLDKLIISTYYDRGNEFFTLLKKEDNNKRRLLDTLHEAEEGRKITLCKVDAQDIPDYIILQLFMSALANFESTGLKVSNLSGHLYCFDSSWLEHSQKNGISKIHALEIRINKDYICQLNVRTFTSIKLRKYISFKHHKFPEYPQYSLLGNNTLKRSLENDRDDTYIMRQTGNDKYGIDFFNFENSTKFEKTKVGMLNKYISKFNAKYEGLINISFEEINDFKTVVLTKNDKNNEKEAIKNIVSNNKFSLIDTINDARSAQMADEIASLLNAGYGIKIHKRKYPQKEAMNLMIIHNKEYYDGEEDIHNKNNQEIDIQHLTYENGNLNKYIVDSLIEELIIKQDLLSKSISIFDWQRLGFNANWIFGLVHQEEENKRYFFMTIKPDGKFEIAESNDNLFVASQYNELSNVFNENDDCVSIINDDQGNTNIINETSYITIPEMEAIKAQLDEGNNKLRDKISRENYLEAVTDIRYFVKGDHAYYFSGVVGNGMRNKVVHAANIREIVPYNNSKLIFESLLPLLNVTFVRNGKLTVVPFPFKYIKEFILMKDSNIF